MGNYYITEIQYYSNYTVYIIHNYFVFVNSLKLFLKTYFEIFIFYQKIVKILSILQKFQLFL